MTPAPFVFLDLETSDLDPHVGCILEVGVIVCDADCQPVAHFTSLVRPSWASGAGWRWLSDWSRDNLDPELTRPIQHPDPRPPWSAVEPAILDLLTRHGSAPYRIAGFSPHFDLRWLRIKSARLHRELSHRIWDVSTLRDMDTLAGTPALHLPSPVRHRALADAEAARSYAAAWLARARSTRRPDPAAMLTAACAAQGVAPTPAAAVAFAAQAQALRDEAAADADTVAEILAESIALRLKVNPCH